MSQGAATTIDPDDEPFGEGFGELVERWRGALIGMLRAWRVPDPDEIAHDVFAEAWLARERFVADGGDRAVGAWLRGIAWNLSAAAARRRQRRKEQALLPETMADPAQDEVGDDRHTSVRRAIDRLPSDLRTAVWMHYLERTPVARIAALLDATTKTIEGRLYRARKQLARMLEEHDGIERSRT